MNYLHILDIVGIISITCCSLLLGILAFDNYKQEKKIKKMIEENNKRVMDEWRMIISGDRKEKFLNETLKEKEKR